MAMAVVSRGSCSNPVTDAPPSSSSSQSHTCSLHTDGLWCDIDLAESYLISSQFDKAAALSSTVLSKLKCVLEPSEHITYGDINTDEMEDIIEAAGMVSIQAYSESGRSQMIFSDLKAFFGTLAKVPSSVFLAGLCLQISAKSFVDAQQSVESFLKNWEFTALHKSSCKFKPTSDHNQRFLTLAPDKYIEIVKLYCVQVLAKGLGRLDLALQWVKEVDIPADRKQEMLEDLDRISSSLDGKDKRDTVSLPDRAKRGTGESGLQVSEGAEAGTEARISKKAIRRLDAHSSSLKSVLVFSPVIDTISSWMSRPVSFLTTSARSSNGYGVLTVIDQRKALFGGAATVFLMVAIYRQRLNLSRIIGSLGKGARRLLRAMFMSFLDFWQLAFSAQLNPLAAVQPFPPAQQLR